MLERCEVRTLVFIVELCERRFLCKSGANACFYSRVMRTQVFMQERCKVRTFVFIVELCERRFLCKSGANAGFYPIVTRNLFLW